MEEQLDEHCCVIFSTATILNWQNLLKPDKYKQIIVDSLSFLTLNNRAKVYEFVVMPNHIHLLWKIIPSYKLSEVQRDFMKFTGQKIKYDLVKNHPSNTCW